MFRKLNAEEEAILAKHQQRHGLTVSPEDLLIDYTHQGTFTAATVRFHTDWAVAIAKFNPFDKNFNPEIGERIAFVRALTKLEPTQLHLTAVM